MCPGRSWYPQGKIVPGSRSRDWRMLSQSSLARFENGSHADRIQAQHLPPPFLRLHPLKPLLLSDYTNRRDGRVAAFWYHTSLPSRRRTLFVSRHLACLTEREDLLTPASIVRTVFPSRTKRRYLDCPAVRHGRVHVSKREDIPPTSPRLAGIRDGAFARSIVGCIWYIALKLVGGERR